MGVRRHDTYEERKIRLTDLQERKGHQYQEGHTERVVFPILLKRETDHYGFRTIVSSMEGSALNEVKRLFQSLMLRLDAVGKRLAHDVREPHDISIRLLLGVAFLSVTHFFLRDLVLRLRFFRTAPAFPSRSHRV